MSSILKETSINGTRNGTADLLKGMAVLFMIQVHVMEQFGTNELADTVVGKISFFLGGVTCAPVFLAVMGYFLAGKDRPLLHILKRGALLFAGGILLNTARSATLLVYIFSGEISIGPWPYLFGADILTLAGIGVVVAGLLGKLVKYNGFILLLLSAGTAFSAGVLPVPHAEGWPAYPAAFIFSSVSWSYFPLIPWLSYILAGMAFRSLSRVYNPGKLADSATGLILMAIAFVILMAKLPWASGVMTNLGGINGYYHHGIVFFGWAILFMAVWLAFVNYLDSVSGNHPVASLVRWTGQRVTRVYVIQWLIIGNLATHWFGTFGLFGYFMASAGVAATAVILSWVAEQIPLTWISSGFKR